MYGVGDAGRAIVKPREGGVSASLIPGDQDDPGAHFCECYCRDFANSGGATRDDDSLPSHNVSSLLIADFSL
jgi:hypothetical protein